MRKFLSAAAIGAAIALILGSCASKGSSEKKQRRPEATSQPFTERVVDETDGTYVFDRAGLLSPDDLKACNDYAGWLYKEKLINAAVITVSDLEGKAPYDYAAEEFNRLYDGKGSGLVILVNNDTKADVVYRAGGCLTHIPDKAEENALYWATKEFFGGDYRAGIMRLLQLGELSPMHIIDNAEVFEQEQLDGMEKALADCKTDITVIAAANGTELSDEQLLKQFYDRKYREGEGIMFMLDIMSGTVTAHSAEKLPEALEKALEQANALAAKGDNAGAVNEITAALD